MNKPTKTEIKKQLDESERRDVLLARAIEDEYVELTKRSWDWVSMQKFLAEYGSEEPNANNR